MTTALVLSGGGAKGSFQAGAEEYVRTQFNYTWDIIAGVSAGALNGSMLAMGKHEELKQLWLNVTNDQIYKGKLPTSGLDMLKVGWKLLMGHDALLDTTPLEKLIDSHYDPAALQGKDLRVGAVSLISGNFEMFTPNAYPESTHPGVFQRAVYASTAVPVTFPPVEVSAAFPRMVDGGVRNLSPLSSVVKSNPDCIVIINCSPRAAPPTSKSPDNFLKIAMRSADIMLNEIFVTDLEEFLRINDIVLAQAGAGGSIDVGGRTYKHFNCTVIEPELPLGDSTDFNDSRNHWQTGYDRAQAVLGIAPPC